MTVLYVPGHDYSVRHTYLGEVQKRCAALEGFPA